MKTYQLTLASLVLGVSSTFGQADYTLQILHASDLEGGVNAIGRAPNFAAIIEHLENVNPDGADGTIVLSAGDNYIPGPFFSASTDFSLAGPLQVAYENLFGVSFSDPIEGSEIETRPGAIDITVMNIIGFDASAIGNHEFDLGSEIFRDLLEEEFDTDRVDPPANIVPAEIEWPGAQFPFLSANLDFSGDGSLAGIATSAILEGSAFTMTPAEAAAFKFPTAQGDSTKIAPAVILDVNGAKVGVVGATTQRLNQISSPTGTVVSGATDNDMAVLAAQLQPVIDDIIDGDDNILGTADDVNKIVIISHLQQLALEQDLATRLTGVDVIVAGGSDTLLADANDVLRPGDSIAGAYPVVATGLDANPVLIVSTDGEYSYVGRINVPFDASGVVLTAELDDTINGPVATTDANVAALWGSLGAAYAANTRAAEVAALITPVETIVANQDGNVFGYTAYLLDGARANIRTQETNMGNLTADANLWKAQQVDSSVVISLKNGGGIRSIIGTIDGFTGEQGPPAANPAANPPKPFGAISELDIADALRFNNGLAALDLSGADLLDILTHGFAQSYDGATQGRFPQLSGLQVSYFPPIDSNGDGAIVSADGDTEVIVYSFALLNANGDVTEVLYKNGTFLNGADTRSFRVVTLDFLAGGGDGYPFASLGANRVDLGIGEQEAMQDYLSTFFGTPESAYSMAEMPVTMDARIQNLDFRLESIGADVPTFPAGAMRLTPVATYASGVFDDSAAEIVAFDAGTQRLFVVSSAGSQVRVLDASDPLNSGLPQVDTIAAPVAGFNPNSVDTFSGPMGDVLAIAWAEDNDGDVDPVVDRGIVTIHDPSTLALIGNSITVGYHPDMLTFTPDGMKIVVANEGEPRFDSSDVMVDNPVGSVSVIVFNGSYANATVNEVGFERWNRRGRVLKARGILTSYLDNGMAASVAEDLEPEYVAISSDGNYAWVGLQEANAAALVDLRRYQVRNIVPFGVVNHMQAPLDASDRDGGINITTEPIFGLRQPDAIAVVNHNGMDYLLTANEGDARDFEEARVKNATFDPNGVLARLPNLQDDAELGRLEFNTAASDLDNDGDIDEILAYGGRSMTVFRAPVVGRFRAVQDTGADIENYTASIFGNVFNSNNDDNDSLESRSDAKGAEPEALTVAEIDGRTYAFLGLERQSAIMVYDVTNPMSPVFHAYASNRSFADENGFIDADTAAAGDLGPEGIEFIPAADSPTGTPAIAVANEVSGTVTLWKIDFGI